MRGRIVGLWSHHRPSFPQIAIQFPSSESIRTFSALKCPTPAGSLGEAPPYSSSHVRPLFQKHSPRDGLPQDSRSYSAPKSSTGQYDLLPFRSISSSACCQCAFIQSFAASTHANTLRVRRFTTVSAKRTERRCWSCEQDTGHGLFCPSCKAIQPLDQTVDFFEIFNIDRSFKVDLKILEQSYKSLQKKLHPDLAGSKSEREREYSADQSAHVIQAYYILLRPLSRARYLLGLHGIRVDEEGTIDDPELLMEIMEIRESISEVSDGEALKAAEAENIDRIQSCEKELEISFRDQNLKRAVSWIQRLAYYNKVGEEILRKL